MNLLVVVFGILTTNGWLMWMHRSILLLLLETTLILWSYELLYTLFDRYNNTTLSLEYSFLYIFNDALISMWGGMFLFHH